MTKRILLLYTGGTIGMDETPEGLAPVPGLLPRLMQRFERDDLHFDILEYQQLIDSSAITIDHWNQLIGDIATHYDHYDGFVIIHGTDTMAYTASVLAFALRGLGKPVVLTGSQLPLVHPRSDGWGNLADALAAASEPDLAEVVLVFDRLMLRGCRARKVDAASFSGFDSPNAPHLAHFGIHIDWQRDMWRQPQGSFNPVMLDPQAQVWMLMLAPGQTAAMFGSALAAHPPAGAVLLSYGNGNAPDDPALMDGIRTATQAGTLLLNLTQVMHGKVDVGAYAASQPLAQAGGMSGGDMTPEAALGKLTVIASMKLPSTQARELLMQDWAGEVSAQ